jgi:hypothetical protein
MTHAAYTESMKTLLHIIAVSNILFSSLGKAADVPAASSQPPAFVMSIACFADTIATKPEWIFVVGGSAFRSLDALKNGLTHFPNGSSLTWAPSCKRMGGEPLSTDAELKAFEAHCKRHGIKFILIPSG